MMIFVTFAGSAETSRPRQRRAEAEKQQEELRRMKEKAAEQRKKEIKAQKKQEFLDFLLEQAPPLFIS